MLLFLTGTCCLCGTIATVDTTKNYGYNMPMGSSAGGYMGGFFPTMAMHYKKFFK